MTTTRSTRLFTSYGLATGSFTVYTVPAGFTAIVKRVCTFIGGTGASFIGLYSIPAGLGLSFFLRYTGALDVNTVDEWDTWFVLEEGDSLGFTMGGSSANCIGFGALLSA